MKIFYLSLKIDKYRIKKVCAFLMLPVLLLSSGHHASALPPVADTTTLGICYFYDTETNVAEQFALFHLFINNPLTGPKGPLKIMLADQPYLTDFAITGTVRGNKLYLKFWESGQTSGNEQLTAKSEELRDILAKAYEFTAEKLQGGGATIKGQKLNFKGMILNSVVSVDAGSGSGLLPGRVPCPVPPSRHNQVLKTSPINFVTPKQLTKYSDPVLIGQLGEALYVRQPETFFLLKNNKIPEELKASVRRLMFPVWSRPGLPVVYLAAAEKFEKAGNINAAASAYHAALVACNRLNTSLFEKSLIKRICFENLSEAAMQREQLLTASLAGLAYTFNDRYLKTDKAKQESANYHELMERIGTTCDKIEEEVRAVRSQKRSNGFMAILNGVAAITSGDNEVASSIYADQAIDALSQSSDLTFNLEQALQEVTQGFRAYDDAIYQQSQDQGESVSAAKTYLAEEITYHLLRNQDNEIEQILIDFASDKPRLNSLLVSYVSAPSEEQRIEQIKNIKIQLKNIEGQAYVYESRGYMVPAEVRRTF